MNLSWKNDDITTVFQPERKNNALKPISLNIKELDTHLHIELKKIEQIGISSENMLILGDNLPAMKVIKAERDKNNDGQKIKFIYIDPPYNTGLNIRNFNDKLEHTQWLSIMKPRLILMRELLSESGLIAVQLDDNEYAALDILMSEIFGEENRLGTIIWRRRSSQANLSKGISTIHDYILIYSKNKNKISRSVVFDPLWTDTKIYGNNQIATKEIEKYFGDRTLFDTPKPESLLTHLISEFTDSGDLIMDCFSGSGTTIAVAHKLNRKWIGIEVSPSTFELSKQRILKINTLKHKESKGFAVYDCRFQLKNSISQSTQEKEEKKDKQQEERLIVFDWKGKNDGFQRHEPNYFIKVLQTNKIEKSQNEDFQNEPPTALGKPQADNLQGKRMVIFEDWEQMFENLPQKIKQIVPKHKIKTIFCSPPIEFQSSHDRKWSIEHYLCYCNQLLRSLYISMSEESFIIFHSIEPHHSKIKLIMDEIFGQNNHVGTVIWKKYRNSDPKPINQWYDLVIIFCKNIQTMKFYKLEPPKEVYSNPDNDPRGPWVSMPLIASEKSGNPCFTYVFKNGITLTRKFRYPEYSIRKLEEENRIHFTHPKNSEGIPRVKKFLYERLEKFESIGAHGYTPNTLCIDTEKFGSVEDIIKNHEKFAIQQFRSPKLYEFLCKITTKKGDWILDCFPQTGDIHELLVQMGRNVVEITFTNFTKN